MHEKNVIRTLGYSFGVLLTAGGMWLIADSKSNPSSEILPAERPLSPPCATGQILFDENPASKYTSSAPYFWFRNEDSGKYAPAEVACKNDRFQIYGLAPGKYGAQITIDANSNNLPNYPGDFYSWTLFEVGKVLGPPITVRLQRIIHMTVPQDNDVVLEGWEEDGCAPAAIISGHPLKLAWESLGPGITYDYKIITVSCPYEMVKENESGSTADSKLSINLPSSNPGQFYILDLHARRQEFPIGVLITHGPTFMAWDYRFRVK